MTPPVLNVLILSKQVQNLFALHFANDSLACRSITADVSPPPVLLALNVSGELNNRQRHTLRSTDTRMVVKQGGLDERNI
jgi:hypothetical protein